MEPIIGTFSLGEFNPKKEELIKKANELKELAGKEDIILVPDNIQITESLLEYSKGIVNGTQQLYYDTKYDHWIVEGHKQTDKNKYKLTPCKHEDLEPGDVFYRSDFEKEDFKSLEGYAIKLNDNSHQFWYDNGCINSIFDWKYYWKVEVI